MKGGACSEDVTCRSGIPKHGGRSGTTQNHRRFPRFKSFVGWFLRGNVRKSSCWKPFWAFLFGVPKNRAGVVVESGAEIRIFDNGSYPDNPFGQWSRSFQTS